MSKIPRDAYYAIIISLSLHVVVLGFLNWYASGTDLFEGEDTAWGEEIEVKLYEIPEPEMLMEIDPVTGEIRNVVANRDAAQSQDLSNYRHPSQSEMAADVYDDLMELEKQVLEELAAEKAANQTDSEKIQKTEESTENLEDYDWFNEESYAGNVTISYSLPGRHDTDLRNPGYTCKVSGQVTLNIEVAQDGAVIAAEVNLQLTTTSDPCLIEQSITYAKLSRFNSTLQAVKKQPGTITYLFLAQ